MTLPLHLRFLDDLAESPTGELADFFPETARNKKKPRKGEMIFEAGGIGYVGNRDGRMVPIAAENLVPMEENLWDRTKFATLVEAVRQRGDILVDPGYADLWEEDGQLQAQVRDGNHRVFAPIVAGEDVSWVLMSDRTTQELDERQGGTKSDRLYTLIRKAQKEAGAPLFQRKKTAQVKRSGAASAAVDELRTLEARSLEIERLETAYYQDMLRKHGFVPFRDEAQQLANPQMYWKLRLKELAKERGEDRVYGQFRNAAHEKRQKEAMELFSRIYDLRQKAGIDPRTHRIDPATGQPVPIRARNPVSRDQQLGDIARQAITPMAVGDLGNASIGHPFFFPGEVVERRWVEQHTLNPIDGPEDVHVTLTRSPNGQQRVLLSYDQDAHVTYGGIKIVPHAGRSCVNDVFVSQEVRGKGLADRLAQIAKSMGVSCVFTPASAAGEAWSRRHGLALIDADDGPREGNPVYRLPSGQRVAVPKWLREPERAARGALPLDPLDPVNVKARVLAWRQHVRETFERQGYYRQQDQHGVQTLTRSTRPGVAFQLTYWTPDMKPTGHMDLATIDDAAGPLWSELGRPEKRAFEQRVLPHARLANPSGDAPWFATFGPKGAPAPASSSRGGKPGRKRRRRSRRNAPRAPEPIG
jgi:hypothetical protein